MLKTSVRWLGVLTMALLLGACVTAQFKAPRLTIVNLGMVSADVFSQQFRIRLHVQNPNARDLPIKSIEYELFLQGDSFAEGTSNQAFVVPALGDAEFDTFVTTNFMSSVGRLISRLNGSEGGKVEYNFVGKVHLSKGLLRSVPFNEQGLMELNIKR